jgi:hypothetical protein
MSAGARVRLLVATAALAVGACASQQPVQPATAAAQPQPVQQPEAREEPQRELPPADRFVVTDELYRRTFDEVREVIDSLTKIIAAGDYGQWLTFLTDDYVHRSSSAEFLAEASRSPMLSKSGVVLRSLRDYFDNVVVRSRVQATLNDITFVDADHVKAITVIQGSPVILYYLVREGGRWKVGIWENEQE